jgi:hypothetical protein
MATTVRYPLETGGPERVEVSWTGRVREVRASFDGKELGFVDKLESLPKNLATFPLPDGRTLEVQYVANLMGREVQVRVDGQPLPGSSSDPARIVRSTSNLIFFIAFLNSALGLWALVASPAWMEQAGLGSELLVMGVLNGILGFFARRASRVAFVLVSLLWVADTLVILADGAGTRGVIVRVALLVGLFRGAGAAFELAKKKKAVPVPAA